MSLAAIVRALGGELRAGGRRANVPAPGHSSADRSVSLLLDGDRVVIHGFGAADWREVRAELERLGLVDRQGRLVGAAAGASDRELPPVLAPAAKRRVAEALWSEGRPLPGTLSARHCARRGVAAPPGGLRHHPDAPSAVYAGRGLRRPALLAAITAPDGSLAGVEVTYLAPDGARAALRTPRKVVGGAPAGSAVRLWPAAAEMLVAEGVFTALSAAAVFGLPAWALLSAGNLARWAPPDGVRRVLVAADRGAAGEQAAARLAADLARRGLAVAVRLPPVPFGDWNEACAGKGEEGRTGASRAAGWSGAAARRSSDDTVSEPGAGPDPAGRPRRRRAVPARPPRRPRPRP